MMGLHPCHVFNDYKTVLTQMEQWFVQRNFVGVGETGIDLYWDKSFVDQQKAAFDIQISWAKSQRLPIIIHSRESIDICIEMISERQDGSLTGVFHCFTGDEMQAKQIKDLGFYIGIGGVVTYKNSELPKVLIDNGLSNVVLETDSPYLPPVPHRGKINEPAFIPYIVEKIGELFQEEIEHVEALTTQNAYQLFNL
jgi:TatD DNase family protein